MSRFTARLVCGVVICGWFGTSAAADRILLDRDMVINLSGQRAASELVDEQGLAGDPRQDGAADAETAYSNGWINADLYYPLSIVVDLQAEYALTHVCYFDFQGHGRFTVDCRAEDTWQSLFHDDLKQYRKWVAREVDVATRYLRLTFENPSAQIGELLLYGERLGRPVPTPEPVGRKRPLMDTFIGLNGFVDDPVERIAAGGHLREYHNWQWDEGNKSVTYEGYPDHELAWSPSWVSGPGWGWDFDAFYRRLKEAGVAVSPCLQGCAPYIVNFDPNRSEAKPVADGDDPTQPASYAAHASYLFQFAARYGSTPVDESLLRLRVGQPARSGLGLVRYIENWNEPDKWWRGREAFFLPFELAAMCSADYDGHRQAMGPRGGVRNADPNMKLVMGGLAGPEIEYLKAMKLWADLHREGDFPADVINLHHYSNDAGGQGGRPTTGISPEADGLRQRFARIVQWCHRSLPGKEVWVSEFGYDTNPRSVQRAPAIGDAPAEEVQGQWLVRSYLALAAAGVDRAQMYMLRDVNTENPVKYNSSGLTSEKWDGHQPKRAWFYVATLHHVLRGTRFDREIPSAHEDVRIYRFRSDAVPRREIYALWCPTSEGTSVPGFVLQVPEADEARLVMLEPNREAGRSISVGIEQGAMTVDVSERPVLLATSLRE